MQSKLPLLPSGPGGVRKSTFHGPWQKSRRKLSRTSRRAAIKFLPFDGVPAEFSGMTKPIRVRIFLDLLAFVGTVAIWSGCTTASAPKSATPAAAAVPGPPPAPTPAQKNIGYTNTPMIPGTSWHVHDGFRPQPRVVSPATQFSQLAPPPSDAVILFDGTDLSKWTVSNSPAKWKVENGYMEVVPKSGSIRTRDTFADFQLHLEFATPSKVEGNSQGRGNSGILFK